MVKVVIRKTYSIFVFVWLAGVCAAQVPTILTLAPDGRSTGMAGLGVATSADANSQYFNVSKYAFAGKGGVALSYAPWMRKLSPDMNTLYLAGFGQLGDNNYLSGAVSFFTLGDITFSDGVTAVTRSPSEWAVDLGYSRRITPSLSLGMAFRYVSAVYADLNVLSAQSAGAFAADAGVYFRQPIGKHGIAAGLSVTNAGTRFDFGGTDVSLPTALRLGVHYMFNFTPEHVLGFGIEGNQPLIAGSYHSFQDVTFSFGAEYNWNNFLMARAGYFYDNKYSGNRSHLSLGVGGIYKGFGLDCSYWVPLSSDNTALSNTFHITLSHVFE